MLDGMPSRLISEWLAYFNIKDAMLEEQKVARAAKQRAISNNR